MKKNLFVVRKQALEVDVAILLVRLVCGIAFVIHGWGKIQHPMSWGHGSSIPGIFQALAAISEFGGGISLILGLLTRLGVFGIACTMLVATAMHRFVWGDPFVSLSGGHSYEPAIVFLAIAILLLVLGAGRYSLDKKIFGAK